MSLPTREEYMKKANFAEMDMTQLWDKELFECPNCGGGVKCDFSVAYMSVPPKHRYFCSCGYTAIF